MSTRTRSRVDLKRVIGRQEDSYGTSCSHLTRTVGSPVYDLYSGRRDSIIDTVVPGFNSRRKRGEVFFNPLTIKNETYTESYFDGEIRSVADSCGSLPGMKATYYLLGGWYSQCIDTVLTPEGYKVPVARWNGTQSDYDGWIAETCTSMFAKRGTASTNLWETLAEARKTTEMLNRPLNQLVKRLGKVITARGKAEKLRQAAGISADYWLMYRYGVMPLVRDVAMILEGLKKAVGRVRVTTRNSFRNETNVTFSRTNAVGVAHVLSNISTNEKAYIRAMALDEYVATVGSNIGFTTKALLTTPWELIPYSFVSDWFFNVGDYLNAVVPAFGYESLGSCYTSDVIRTTTWASSTVTSNHSGYVIHTPFGGTITATVREKVRLPCPTPSLVVKHDFRFDRMTRQIDAAALLGQLFIRAFEPGPTNNRSRRVALSRSSSNWGAQAV